MAFPLQIPPLITVTATILFWLFHHYKLIAYEYHLFVSHDNNEKKTIAKVYASDYNTYFKYNTISGNPLQNKQAFKEIINNIDFTQILYDPENTNNKMLEIVVKDKKGTATFYYENNIVNYIVPITENGISNIGKYYNENGIFVADITTENGYITEIKCAGGRKLNPATMDNVSHIQYLCK